MSARGHTNCSVSSFETCNVRLLNFRFNPHHILTEITNGNVYGFYRPPQFYFQAKKSIYIQWNCNVFMCLYISDQKCCISHLKLYREICLCRRDRGLQLDFNIIQINKEAN